MLLMLYSDLPEHRKILSFEVLAPEALLHRYNCAQIQGLILRSSNSRVARFAPEARRRFRRKSFNGMTSRNAAATRDRKIALAAFLFYQGLAGDADRV